MLFFPQTFGGLRKKTSFDVKNVLYTSGCHQGPLDTLKPLFLLLPTLQIRVNDNWGFESDYEYVSVSL